MHQVRYVKITEITNERDDLKVEDEIRVPYDCILKLINWIINFVFMFKIF